MKRSEIEKLIVSRRFQYLQPYFYTNPFALRCELGLGGGAAFRESARRRAYELHDILMPGGADAIIFNYRITDHSGSGPAEAEVIEGAEKDNERYARYEDFMLRFLLDKMARYRHRAVKGLKPSFDDEGAEGLLRRVRMVCFSDGRGFDDRALIDLQLDDCPLEIGLVSFANECILSVYDDRGCDITFATREKMREFYPILKPYFLAYDIEEMKRRYKGE